MDALRAPKSAPVGLTDPPADDSIGGPASNLASPGGIPIRVAISPLASCGSAANPAAIRLHLAHTRLMLLRGFDELLCLEGLRGVEHLPHQIETVRKVLRHFRGRVLLADEVGLGKTIEACLLLREYLLRGLIRRVLILVPAPLVSQWREELSEKFGLEFAIPPRTKAAGSPEFWVRNDLVLSSLSFAKLGARAQALAEIPWDLVIVDEAHHCKNRTTKNWQLINSLKRRHMFLLTATPVQNDLVELYNLLTLLEPGHLRTEADFKKQYVRRGNPRDPRHREKLRQLLGEVMIRNTRSLVQMDLPPRYAETIQAEPAGEEQKLHEMVQQFLRERTAEAGVEAKETSDCEENGSEPAGEAGAKRLTRMQLSALLAAQGSHPQALGQAIASYAASEPAAAEIVRQAERIEQSAKDRRLLELIAQSRDHKLLVFANFRRTIRHLQSLLDRAGVAYSTFSGEETAEEKDAAVEALRDRVPVMICSDSGGEGRNLQFADTVINYDLPWNPMRIEQRIGRVHRIGQKQPVFVFNLCTAGSLEARILSLLHEKIRMFELVVGEIGSILGNLEGGEEFDALVLNLWLKSADDKDLEKSFDQLGDSLLSAQAEYLQAKELDEALFGEDYE
ncbi:MAG TPA: SNF2-related protein [Pirellulaceae bacterium]|nr:SNF2-related protein [Pirellulaceae bacterium]